ncbi:MAG: hypothetical protein AAGI66_04170 [Cyanobacteria bacterium P01_H01_bin.74]
MITGIDFSGAASPGSKIWLCSLMPKKPKEPFQTSDWVVSQLTALKTLMGKTDKKQAYSFLVNQLAHSSARYVGIDASLSLPAPLMQPYQSWHAWLKAFPQEFSSPESFQKFCKGKSHGKELKRQTDILAKTPFSPYNLRHYKQTYYAVSAVLHPLVNEHQWQVYQLCEGNKSVIAEVCPASFLKHQNNYKESPYKGPLPAHKETREIILKRLLKRHPNIHLTPQQTACILSDCKGDALDALICTVIVLKHLPVLQSVKHLDPKYEGEVLF